MKPLWEYLNYREYLKDYYVLNKQQNKYFSYRYFALKANVKSPDFLKRVMEGKRNLTRNTMEGFSKALKLDEKSTQFFHHLVGFNQAKTPEEKQEHYLKIRNMIQGVSPKSIPRDLYDYFDKWYNVAIRELVCIYDFKDDYSKIGKALTPSIKPLEVKKTINMLIQIGLIKKLKNGTYKQSSTILTTGKEVKSLAVRKFNASMILLAYEALERFGLEERNISGITFGLSKNSYEMIVKETNAYKDRVLEIINDEENPDRVYQMNIQIFPLTERTLQNQGEKKEKRIK